MTTPSKCEGGGEIRLSQFAVEPEISSNPRQCGPSLCLALAQSHSAIVLPFTFGHLGAVVHGIMPDKPTSCVSPQTAPIPSKLISHNGDPDH